MGRLFQYNRFGSGSAVVAGEKKKTKDSDTKKDKTPSRRLQVLPYPLQCPLYSVIYSDYSDYHVTKEVYRPTTNKNLSNQKCQNNKHSSKKAEEGDGQSKCCSKSNISSTTSSTTTTSGYSSREQDKTANQSSTALSRTQKAYVCMKDFLRRKFFQQHGHELLESKKSKEVLEHQSEDTTSDFDEQEVLDSSYNADEEEDEDATDCSCTYTSSESGASSPIVTKISSPRKSVLSLNCWQSSNPSDESSGSEAESDELDDDHENSDCGISDCHQLVSEKSKNLKDRCPTPKPKAKRKQPRYNTDNDDYEEEELLKHTWYQPLITVKAATEHLKHAIPGSFIVRRRNANAFELCLRTDGKVKQFTLEKMISKSDAGSFDYKLKGAKKQFSTLKALITHHSVMAEQLPLALDLPREPEEKEPTIRYADDFEPLESLQLLGILKSLQVKHFEW